MSVCALVAKDWRELSKAASQEHDPEKLMELIKQLNEVLKEREEKVFGRSSRSNFQN
ncbi:MAG TPA: hypothetical protein VFI95_00185 [Terriglobales bacterium]|nr:hypothetical protein [Terriglobales bacterium]